MVLACSLLFLKAFAKALWSFVGLTRPGAQLWGQSDIDAMNTTGFIRLQLAAISP